MKKTNAALALRPWLILLLIAILLSLQACITDTPDNGTAATSSHPVNGKTYLYQTMTYEYKTDISQALQYITTGLDAKYLLLANKEHPLGSDYSPDTTVNLTCPTYGGKPIDLEPQAAYALYAMLAEMAADGVTDIYVTSGYRTYAYQVTLFNNYLNKESASITADAKAYLGEEYIQSVYLDQGKNKLSREDAERVVLSYSAYPGTSEHQTGLCVDFVTSTAMLDRTFENTEAFSWLSLNAYRFGFILRYPEDKVDITGYSYEPWHYRFVGREAATEIALRNLTLEEFLNEASGNGN